MNDRERISRLVGAAISECSSSGLAEVRRMLVRAVAELGAAEERKRPEPEPRARPHLKGMTRDQARSALDAIEGMIESEKSRGRRDEPEADLFG